MRVWINGILTRGCVCCCGKNLFVTKIVIIEKLIKYVSIPSHSFFVLTFMCVVILKIPPIVLATLFKPIYNKLGVIKSIHKQLNVLIKRRY